MPRIAVLATGGTIASRRSGDSVVATDKIGALTEHLHLPDVELVPTDVMTIGSYRMGHRHLREIADAVATALAAEGADAVDGVVITHGTDTMEETAILLDLVQNDSRPVVLTGAQRGGDVPDTDGPRNLADAVAVAASPLARDLGTTIVFDGNILPARGTRKLHTTALNAFGSLTGGSIGTVADGRIQITALPRRPKALNHPAPTFDTTRVDLIDVYPGADGGLLRAAAGLGAAGIVLCGTGIGNANPDIVATVTELVEAGVVVAVSSRVPRGPILGVYGRGGGADLVSAGAVLASGLPATQVRIMLALLLSQGADVKIQGDVIADHAENQEERS